MSAPEVKMRPGPLAGYRVIDFSQAAAGPFCTQHLGDFGADIIKVEPPEGDMIRGWNVQEVKGLGTYFIGINRNKRSLRLDLKQERGRTLAMQLCAQADIVVENYRPGAMARLGLDYESVRAHNPRVIYTSITAFGEDGPLRNQPGMDIILQAFGGMMGITGVEGGEPVKVGSPVADLGTGYAAALATMAAVVHRERTGEGQLVRLSMLNVVVSLMSNHTSGFLMYGSPVHRMGSAHPQLVPYQAFKTGDGEYLILGVLNERFWANLCLALDRSQWLNDPHYRVNEQRVQHREQLLAELRPIIGARPIAEWEAVFTEFDVPNCRVNSFESLFSNPQLEFERTVVNIEHPVWGNIKVIDQPARLAAFPNGPHRPPPLLGEHSREILLELGIDAQAITDLEVLGVI
jgi:crotonobetainyl-CoA:carnitine CoA-transferase CaiB-like acyl-CoA transferase